MFDLWGTITKNGGRSFVERHVEEFSPLEWVELGERFPDLVPESAKGYDWENDPAVIRESPFVRLRRRGNRKWREDNFTFRVRETQDRKELLATAYIDGAIASLTYTDIRFDYEIGYDDKNPADDCPAFGCSCGSPFCDGYSYEWCHVSQFLVHWTIVRGYDKYELYYDRAVYDRGVVTMLRRLIALAHSKSPRRRRACGISQVERYERTLTELVASKGVRRDNLDDFKILTRQECRVSSVT